VTSYAVTYSLVTVGGSQALQMTLDNTWLDSKSRVYPVTVDPSVSAVNANGSTYVQYPDDNDFSSDTELHIGTYDGGSDYAKSFIAFGNVASQLKNDTVLGAWLGVFNTWSYSCSPRPVYVYPVTSSWSVSGDKSWPGPSTGSAIGQASFATGWVPLGSTSSPCPASWENIGLDQAGTNLVNGWTHGTIADNGLAIGASDSDSYSWKQFWSDANSQAHPFLSVTYTTDGASYKMASRTPVTEVTPSQNGKLAVDGSAHSRHPQEVVAIDEHEVSAVEVRHDTRNVAGRAVVSDGIIWSRIDDHRQFSLQRVCQEPPPRGTSTCRGT